jgi:hypothetical protein
MRDEPLDDDRFGFGHLSILLVPVSRNEAVIRPRARLPYRRRNQ